MTWRVREGGESVKNEVITSTPCLYLYSSHFLYQIVCCICTVSVCINWGSRVAWSIVGVAKKCVCSCQSDPLPHPLAP